MARFCPVGAKKPYNASYVWRSFDEYDRVENQSFLEAGPVRRRKNAPQPGPCLKRSNSSGHAASFVRRGHRTENRRAKPVDRGLFSIVVMAGPDPGRLVRPAGFPSRVRPAPSRIAGWARR